MGILDETRFVERLQFFNGQRLFASDLQGIEAFNREMRWLHNQSLHQPGIGNGFAVTGKRGDREVQIGPGYALDALGREIVLTRGVVEQVPPVASEPDGKSVFFDLTVSYPADNALEVAETREGICLLRGAVRLREEPVLCWVRLKRDDEQKDLLQPEDPRLREEILKGLRIVLARIEVLDCRLKQDISLKERRSARPSRLPFIACGEAQVEWDIKNANGSGSSSASGYEVFRLQAKEVDTSQAGFQLSPCYAARIAGKRLQQITVNGVTVRVYLFDHPANVLISRPKSFDLDLLVAVRLLSGSNVPDVGVLFEDWLVAWMGVE